MAGHQLKFEIWILRSNRLCLYVQETSDTRTRARFHDWNVNDKEMARVCLLTLVICCYGLSFMIRLFTKATGELAVGSASFFTIALWVSFSGSIQWGFISQEIGRTSICSISVMMEAACDMVVDNEVIIRDRFYHSQRTMSLTRAALIKLL